MLNSAFNISDDFAKLHGMKAWGLRRTHGSMFFLELGKPVQIGRFHHGEWHFLFEQSEWQIQSPSGAAISSADDAKSIDVTFDDLDLGQLTNASLDTSDVLHLNFSSGH